MSAAPPLRLAILISGRGSNLAAIARACAEHQINAVVEVVIADRPGAAGLEIARSLGIPTAVVPWQSLTERAAAEGILGELLDAYGPGLIVLAGFMRILSPQFAARYAGQMLNIHPSLLPKYRGLHTHRRVLQAGDPHHGASVHFVTGELDGGPVVLQSRVAVNPGDTEAVVSGRVQKTEHIIYPRVIGWLADKRLTWRDTQPWFDEQPLTQALVEDFRD
jgi:phosphoribosylglycinamide formyltransferase-1